MDNRILADAHNLKKLIREAEALADEAIIAMARLKQAMLAARQNPEVEVNTGQRALLRLTEAESQALAMSTNLLRVHDELSKVAEVHAGPDSGIPTTLPPSDLAALPTRKDAMPA
ncbi:hypothetical protein [Erythrobacter sp. WG]|uniref:hypothetical protein n=1 Tax=Erythrobacter sp. WG TaxID=2985510 RepID=UPI00226EE613|nr:hypothetical protein [Erythrobacter sp. WG]MCX9146057.1 hypothetical protein [Erythrobacter sp. WG]